MLTNFRSYLPTGLVKMRSSAILLTILLLMLLAFGSVQAQDTTTESARLRVFVFARDASAMEVLLNNERISELATMPPTPWFANDYLDVPAGDYTISFVLHGENSAAPLFDPSDVILEAGHDYTAAVIGLAADDALQMVLIDETVAFEEIDLQGQAARIIVHAVYGAPNLDFYLDEVLLAEDIAFGEYVVSVVPGDGQPETYLLTETGNPDAVFLSPPPFGWRMANAYRFTGISGTYPGEPGPRGDYSFLIGMLAYTGEINVADAGSIGVGETVEVGLSGQGHRSRYGLVVASPITLDILLVSRLEDTDPVLRIYDSDGNLLYANDEIVAFDANYDAGFEDLELAAGTYIIEAASFGDLFPGTYWLTVAEAG